MAEDVFVVGLKELGETLKRLPAELASKNGGPLRAALFQAAKLIRDEARNRAPVHVGSLGPKRDAKQPPGTLKRNIVAKRDRNPAQVGLTERYSILVRTGKNQKTGDAYYWKFVEFGHAIVPRKPKGKTWKKHRAESKGGGTVPARPFMRPAFEVQKNAALARFKISFAKGVARAVVKSRGGKR